jgi:hypothetical protein
MSYDTSLAALLLMGDFITSRAGAPCGLLLQPDDPLYE